GSGGSRSGKVVSHSGSAVGLSISVDSARLELFTAASGTTYTGLLLTNGAVTTVGFPSAFTLDVANAFVRYNAVSLGTTKLDWSTATGVSQLAEVTDTLALAVGADVGFTLGGTVFVGGAFTLTTSTGVAVGDSHGFSQTGSLVDLSLTGLSVFAGSGGSRTGK